MKTKALLTILCTILCNITGYGQEFKDIPRKEMPQDELTQIGTRATGEYVMNEFPTIGEDVKAIVILAEFDDVRFSIPHDSLRTLLSKRYNADNYTEEVSFDEFSDAFQQSLKREFCIPGSARDYFRSQSFGKFVPSFDVVGPVTLEKPRAEYGANKSNGKDKNTLSMIKDACKKASEKGTDFTNYDNDGDGKVDIVYVVYAGCDEAQTANAPNKVPDAIWAKASSSPFKVDGIDITVARYACSGELVMDLPEVAGIGTFVHEFSHVLGLPDFYNTQADDFTMDVWSVMDYGMYNMEGFVPCAYTAFERYSLGWIPMHTLDAPATLSIGITDEEERGYRIYTSDKDTTSFYMLETIRQEGWNRYAANYYGDDAPLIHGLLISEVTYDASAWENNTVNAGSQHRHCIVPANNVYYYKNAHLHLFGNSNHEFTLSSTPASITQFGTKMNKPITDITYDKETGTTSFNFCGGNITDGVGGLKNQESDTQILYDLQGRIVEHPSKGIYLRDGKKIVIK